ncbi:MAG TPA: MFS transporter [Myxococcales bacterium]|nr:MFS transporter [Myxococcales bacterium]
MRKPHPAFITAFATFCVLLCAAAIRATPGVLIVPLEQEFGWSRATISFAISINLLLYGLMGPFCAAIAARVGIRRTMATAMGLLALSLFAATYIHAPWQLVLIWGFCVGGGTGMAALVIGAVVVTRWFSKHRGLVMGMLTASTATGQLLFLPVLARAVESDGWRMAVRIVGIAALGAMTLALLFVRESPAAAGVPAFGDTEVRPIEPPAENPARVALRVLAKASRSEDFWLLSGTFFICGASTNGLIGTHLIPACVDHGIPEVRAAGLLAVMGIFDLAGTTFSGWLTDRFDGRKLLFTYYALRGLSLIFLPRALTAQSGLFIFAVFYGLDWIATVPPTMRLATESFGDEGPIVFGWIVAAHQVGAGIAALGAGLVRTSLGDYQLAFMSAGALCLIAALLALAVGRVRIARQGHDVAELPATSAQ